MSKYTTEVRFICESLAKPNDTGFDDVESIIANSVDKIFNFNFPIFDESYRRILETKILRHYYTREIGEETVGLWKLRLNTKLNEIMPYYNKLYETELLEFNPLYTKDITRKGFNKGNGSSKDTDKHNTDTTRTDNLSSTRTDNLHSVGNTNASGKNLYSDTPQGTINNIDVVENAYLTNATITGDNSRTSVDNTGTQKTDNTGTQRTKLDGGYTLDKIYNNVDEYLENISGYDGTSASKLVKEFREILLNIDMMIIEELEVLFMNIW